MSDTTPGKTTRSDGRTQYLTELLPVIRSAWLDMRRLGALRREPEVLEESFTQVYQQSESIARLLQLGDQFPEPVAAAVIHLAIAYDDPNLPEAPSPFTRTNELRETEREFRELSDAFGITSEYLLEHGEGLFEREKLLFLRTIGTVFEGRAAEAADEASAEEKRDSDYKQGGRKRPGAPGRRLTPFMALLSNDLDCVARGRWKLLEGLARDFFGYEDDKEDLRNLVRQYRRRRGEAAAEGGTNSAM